MLILLHFIDPQLQKMFQFENQAHTNHFNYFLKSLHSLVISFQ